MTFPRDWNAKLFVSTKRAGVAKSGSSIRGGAFST